MFNHCLITPSYYIILVVSSTLSSAFIINLELEKFQGVNRAVVHKDNASNGKVVLLLSKHIARYEMCVHSPINVSILNVIYSKDKCTGSIIIYLDEKMAGSFLIDKHNFSPVSELERYDTSGPVGTTQFMDYGKHTLAIEVVDVDSGIELDFVSLDIGNKSLLNENLACDIYCFDDIKYGDPKNIIKGSKKFSFNKYTKDTVCAEEENIKIGFHHDEATFFKIKASRPLYKSCANFRDADLRGCSLASPAWEFKTITLKHDETIFQSHRRASLSIKCTGTLRIVTIVFDMFGYSITRGLGEKQTAGRLFLRLGNISKDLNVTVKLSYNEHSGYLKYDDSYIFTIQKSSHTWYIQDYYWADEKNTIQIEMTTNNHSLSEVLIEELRLDKRKIDFIPLKIADDENFVFEVLSTGRLQFNQTTMTVQVGDTNSGQTNVSSLRLYMKKPFDDGYSQIFVIDFDGHARLQPVTKHGVDWVPFGSSVIIGPNNPEDNKPSAPIKSITIFPKHLRLNIRYKDNSFVNLRIKANPSVTVVRIVKYRTNIYSSRYALVTFLSTWIQNGFSFVDHMSVDGVEESIMNNIKGGNTRKARKINFYRKCLSRLNTQSPDIEITAPRLRRNDF